MKENDWYAKEVEEQHRQREYLGNLSEEEREERQRIIAQLKEPIKKSDEQRRTELEAMSDKIKKGLKEFGIPEYKLESALLLILNCIQEAGFKKL